MRALLLREREDFRAVPFKIHEMFLPVGPNFSRTEFSI